MPNLTRRDASATSGGELTTGAQTIAGAKTFSGATTLSGGLVGKTDGVAVAASYIGQKISANLGSATTVTANTFVDASGTLPLTAGSWLVFVNASCSSVFVTGQGAGQIAMRDSANVVIQRFNFTPVVTATATTSVGIISFVVQLDLSTPTTYKMSIQCSSANSASAMSINADESTPIGGFSTDSSWYAVRIT